MNKKVKDAIKKNFINPLKYGCRKSLNKLKVNINIKHKETERLLRQSLNTLDNVENNLNNYKFVDANILMRSAFEYMLTAYLIEEQDDAFNEFINIKIGNKRKLTRPNNMVEYFSKHIKVICKDIFKGEHDKTIQSSFANFYDYLCRYTHASLFVIINFEYKNDEQKKIIKQYMLENFYFIKLLLYFLIKYYTKDDEYKIEVSNISFSAILNRIDIEEKVMKNPKTFRDINDLFYKEQNKEYFDERKEEINKYKRERKKLSEDVQNKPSLFINALKEFLK